MQIYGFKYMVLHQAETKAATNSNGKIERVHIWRKYAEKKSNTGANSAGNGHWKVIV